MSAVDGFEGGISAVDGFVWGIGLTLALCGGGLDRPTRPAGSLPAGRELTGDSGFVH